MSAGSNLMPSRTVRRRVKKLLLWTEILFILILGAGVGIVGGAFYQIRKILPPEDNIRDFKPIQGTRIYSSDGHLLAQLAHENRDPVRIERIPKDLQNAVIAIEDERFYQHSGLDFRGLIRAVWQNLRGGDLTQQGGSTITQQLARNIYLSSRKTLSRKLKETMLAVQIERNWSKRQILEMYMNQVYFGSRAYGVQAAAKIYFGKDVEKLNLAECALIAGLPQRPSKLSPYHNLEAATRRRNLVLAKMAEQGYITSKRLRQALQQPIRLAYNKEPAHSKFYDAPYFVSYVLDQLQDTYGDDLIYKGGFNVVTTLNWKMQKVAERALVQGVRERRRLNIHDGALVCIDPHTGYIRAMVGGVDFMKDQWNTVTQARRQPGSSFKLFVYTAAIDNDGWSTGKIISCRARSVKQADGSWWTVHDHSKREYGSVPMIKAFALSINPAAVNTIMDIGPATVVDYARRLGIQSPLRAYPSLALGSSEVTPLELTSAYGVFAANGVRAEPMTILRVKSREGEIIQDNTPRLHRVNLQPETIAAINELTQAVVQWGTGTAANVVPDAHGKTGTTDDYTDAWFIGYTPDLVTGVWLGNRNNAKMYRSYGGHVSAPIWADFMQEAVKLNPKTPRPKVGELVAEAPAPKPSRDRGMAHAARAEAAVARDHSSPEGASHDGTASTNGDATSGTETDRVASNSDSFGGEVNANANSVVRVRVCDETYDLATPNCPSTRILEFMSGMQPRQMCQVHGAHAHRPRAPKRPAPQQPQPAQAP
jgi:penicillin-binding protein 1A